MTLDELKTAVDDYFGDTTRDKAETADGLREIAGMCDGRAEAIESELED